MLTHNKDEDELARKEQYLKLSNKIKLMFS